jgi:hypothetical protein
MAKMKKNGSGINYSKGSPSFCHRGNVPTTISNDFSKHANLPTDAVSMNYPYCDYLNQYVGDSIVEAERVQNGGVRSMRKQDTMEKY